MLVKKCGWEQKAGLLGVFDGSVHGTKESAAVFHKTMKVDFVQEVTLGITDFISIISTYKKTRQKGRVKKKTT